MKKLAIILAAALLLLTGCTTNVPEPQPTAAPADPPAVEPTETPEPAATTEATAAPAGFEQPKHTYTTGTVDRVEGAQIWLKETGSEQVSVTLVTSATTAIIDAKTGKKAELSSIKSGDVIAAEISIAQAQSMPPQSPTFAVYVNLTEDPIPPRYAEVTAIETKDDGATWITTDINSVWIISATTELLNYSDGSKADLASIKAGSKLVGWYQIETRSMPSQATPTRIVVLP
jgi:hypothetical protein